MTFVRCLQWGRWVNNNCMVHHLQNHIAMHYWGYMSLEVKGRWGLLLPPCLLITAVKQPGTSSPLSQLKHSFTNISFPLSWSSTVVSSQWIRWWFPTHALLQLTSPSPPSRRHLSVPSVSSGLPNVDLAAAAGDTIYHIRLLTKRWCILDFGQHWAESLPWLKDYSDVELPANMLDVLTHSGHVWYHHQSSSSWLLVSAVACVCGAEACIWYPVHACQLLTLKCGRCTVSSWKYAPLFCTLLWGKSEEGVFAQIIN